jgi:acyl-CoA hydrolase
MESRKVTTQHLVKGEDLNHHGTLFAGRAAEWFVESGFLAAAAWVPAENIVLVKINSMTFSRPVKRGAVLRLDSEVVRAGRTSLEAHVEGFAGGNVFLEGSIIFVSVDEEGRPMAHGIVTGS